MKTILKIISAPFRFVAWFVREILIFILRYFYGCMVIYPQPKREKKKKKGKKNGK